MSRIALPSILQQSTVSIGMMLVQSVINGFGSETLAGFSAAMRIESMCIVPMTGIGNALSSYTAQNIGAGRKERVVQGYHAANGMIIGCAVIICAVLEIFSRTDHWTVSRQKRYNGCNADRKQLPAVHGMVFLPVWFQDDS
jgi:Na+-driven multidrug efflux pump